MGEFSQVILKVVQVSCFSLCCLGLLGVARDIVAEQAIRSDRNHIPTRKALVIGGTGFMGRHVVPALLDAGVAVEIISDGRSVNPWGARVPAFVCDRTKPCLAQKLSEGPWDLVVDFPVFSPADLAAIVNNSMWIRHYVFPSSDDVYQVCNPALFAYGSTGGLMEHSAMRPANLSEQLLLNQWDSYGSNKKKLEEVLAGSNVNYTALRLPDVWGPYESTGRFVVFLRSLELGKSIGTWVSSGNPVFPKKNFGGSFVPGFVFAKDVARMVLLLLHSGPQRKPVNVAISERPTFNELATETYRLLREIKTLPMVGSLTFDAAKAVPLLSTDVGPLDLARAAQLGFTPTPWRVGWRETVVALVDVLQNASSLHDAYAKCVKHCDLTCRCEPIDAFDSIQV